MATTVGLRETMLDLLETKHGEEVIWLMNNVKKATDR
jgi:hypothetical protein